MQVCHCDAGVVLRVLTAPTTVALPRCFSSTAANRVRTVLQDASVCFSMARISSAALLVILALGVTPSSAIRCWVCNSENDNRCGDPFQKYEESFYIDCNNVLPVPKASDYASHRQVCVKTTRRIDSYRTLVHRSCEWGHVSNIHGTACNARENNPFLQNNYGGGYPQAQVSYPGGQNYPSPGGYPGSQYPPPSGYQQGGYRQGGYQQGGYQQGGYQQNYPSNYGSGSYGSGSYGSGGYGSGSGGYGSSYGDYCVVCTTDGCNSAPHSVVVTPLTALAALLAPFATWLLARR